MSEVFNVSELERIKQMDKAYITPDDASKVLMCDPQWIRITARDNPEALGFKVLRVGNRTKILRLPFIAFIEGGGALA